MIIDTQPDLMYLVPENETHPVTKVRDDLISVTHPVAKVRVDLNPLFP